MASGTSELQLNVKYGPEQLKVELSIPETDRGEVLTVQRLKNKLSELTGVPQDAQRLIHKGKSLLDPDTALHTLGLKNGSKVMLLGSKPAPKDEPDMTKLRNVESDIGKKGKDLSDVIYQLDSIHRGFVEENMKGPQLTKLRKEIVQLRENFLRMLETLDSLRFDENNTQGPAKKRTLSQRLEKLSDRVDDLLCGLDDIRARFGYY